MIDHAKVIDGFGDLVGRDVYEPREVRCGRCGRFFTFTAADQKYVHEVRGVPVKMADRGAAYCDACVPLRAEENRTARRRSRSLRAIEEARARMELDPRDAAATLDVVRAHLAILEQQPSVRSAERLVVLARRARRLDPDRLEARYWEGRALEAAGQAQGAARALEAFIESTCDRPGHGKLVTDAKARLARAAHG